MMRTRFPGRYVIACLVACLALSTARAEEQLSWAQKMFDKQSHDFGVVARGAEVRHRFKVTNIYKETVHITNVRTTCGCSAATPTKYTLASREVAYIEVTMDTRRFMRQKDSNLVVTFDAPFPAEVKLPIKAYIRTDVVLTPGAANFGPVDQGAEVVRKIEVAYAGRDNWMIKGINSDSKHLVSKITEISRGQGKVTYELIITLKGTAPQGALNEQITLVTNDENSPHVPVLIDGQVESDITITPAVLSLGMMTPGKDKTVNVVLRGKKPFAIEKIECEQARDVFKVRLSKAPRQIHVLPITVTPPAKTGVLSEEFTVSIAGRPAPLKFKVYGEVGPTKE